LDPFLLNICARKSLGFIPLYGFNCQGNFGLLDPPLVSTHDTWRAIGAGLTLPEVLVIRCGASGYWKDHCCKSPKNGSILDTVFFLGQGLELVFHALRLFRFNAYEKTRNLLYMDGTSKLSPYLRFGVLSLREILNWVIEETGLNSQYVKELAWREFWYHIKLNFPLMRDLEFQEKRRGIQWKGDDKFLEAIRSAETGYPIIDAAIRQLISEGWMHNRARMILASFFTKDLLLDWRLGEGFFKEHLLDYDEVVNIGNWQWNASVGPDPKPLRIFNPILQAQRFDPEATFIKGYIPELGHIPAHMLHNPLKYELPYPRPIVDHYKRLPLIKRVFMYGKQD